MLSSLHYISFEYVTTLHYLKRKISGSAIEFFMLIKRHPLPVMLKFEDNLKINSNYNYFAAPKTCV